MFELYQLGLDSEILLDGNGQLSPSAYKNIVAVGLKLKEFNWTVDFIKVYAEKLEDQYQKDYLNLSLAKFYFAREEYDKVLEYLIGIDYKDIFVVLDARTHLLKTYYEMDEFDVLTSQLESFKHFILRRKEIAYHNENYLNIIKYIKRLTKQIGTNKKEKEKFREKIVNEKVLTEKSWLLEKVDEA